MYTLSYNEGSLAFEPELVPRGWQLVPTHALEAFGMNVREHGLKPTTLQCGARTPHCCGKLSPGRTIQKRSYCCSRGHRGPRRGKCHL